MSNKTNESPQPSKGSPRKCTPVWGSCNLPTGHKGQHNAQAKWPPSKDSPASGERSEQPLAICSECGRKTWSMGQVGTTCNMLQPNSWRCGGLMMSQRSEPRGQQQEWGIVYHDTKGCWQIIASDGRVLIDGIGEFRFPDTRSQEKAAQVLAEQIKDNHSAELAAERKGREQAERDYKICCTMRDNHSKQLGIVLPIRIKLEQQLLSALAAIEKHNKTLLRPRPQTISLDLSALHEHDAQVRKPLVEALEHCEKLIKMLAGSLDGKWHNNTLAWDACKEKGWLADALAKVKEGK